MAGRYLTHKGAGMNALECDHWKDVGFHPGFHGTAPCFGARTQHEVDLVAGFLFLFFSYLWLIDVLKFFGEMMSKKEKASWTLYFGVGFPFFVFNLKAF